MVEELNSREDQTQNSNNERSNNERVKKYEDSKKEYQISRNLKWKR